MGDSLRTGDLVLFAGRGLLSTIIRIFTRSRWTHVALVVRLPGHEAPLLLEAIGTGEAPDVLAGHAVGGVGLVSFRQRVAEYEGRVGLRRHHGPALTPARERMLLRLAARLYLRPYRNFLWSLLFDGLFGRRRRRDYAGVCCSELVAELYRRLGWLPRAVRASRFVPGHFGENARSSRVLARRLAPVEIIKAIDGPDSGRPATALERLVRERPLRRQSHAGP
jgi:hypothetical protein